MLLFFLEIHAKLEFFDLKLSCNAFTGQTHQVSSKIIPIECAQTWKGPKLEIIKQCNGNSSEFIIKNIGKADMTKNAIYKVYLNDYILETNDFKLATNRSITFSYPTYGKVLSIEILDPHNIFPVEDYYYASLESCGRNIIGLINTGYSNSHRTKTFNKSSQTIYSANTLFFENKIQEMSSGLGGRHYLKKADWLEYTLQLRNRTKENINKLEITLEFNENFDLATFELMNGEANIIIEDTSNLKLIIENYKLTDSTDLLNSMLYLKFRVKSKTNIPPDSRDEIYYSIQGFGIYNSIYSQYLYPGMNRIIFNNDVNYLTDSITDPNIISWGGEEGEYWQEMLIDSKDNKYILSNSSSYNKGYSSMPHIIKLNKNNQLEWEKSFFGDENTSYAK